MKKQMIVSMLAGLAMTTAFANVDSNTQSQDKSGQPMQAQPQNGAADGQQANGSMSGMNMQQDNTGSQD